MCIEHRERGTQDADVGLVPLNLNLAVPAMVYANLSIAVQGHRRDFSSVLHLFSVSCLLSNKNHIGSKSDSQW